MYWLGYLPRSVLQEQAPLVCTGLNEVLARLYTWCCEYCLTPHPSKTEYMLLSGRGQLTGPKQAIKMGDYVIEEVVSTRCLGVQINNALKWDHVSELAKLFTQKLNLLQSLYFLPRQVRTDFYFGVILPSVTYGMLVWGSFGQTSFSNLEFIHVRAAKIIVNLCKDDVALDDVENNRKMTQYAYMHTKLNYLRHIASRQRRQNCCFGGRSSAKEKVSLW